MVITLIGYRGSGKSTVARPLAERLGWQWADADDLIEIVAGKTIAEIFADDGEPEFRRIEREVMQNLLHRENLIIAAGGGSILNAETRRECKEMGPVFWLQADVETLERRIYGDATTESRRPNLTNTGGREEIETVLEQRAPLYSEAATHTIDTEKYTPEEIVNIMQKVVESMLEGNDA